MTLSFSARIEGKTIRCQITSSVPLKAPTFCSSLMSVPLCRSGGVLVRQVAGYGEVALPDLAGGVPHVVDLACASGAAPANRPWLPLGGYIRNGGQCLDLPRLPAGIANSEPTPAELAAGLRLVPQPTARTPGGGTLSRGAVTASHPALADADALGRRTGLGPLPGPGPALEVVDDFDIAPETYRLELTQNLLRLTASSRAGFFHGAVTLLQLRATHDGEVPCGVIEDAPRFGWRGQHLDCARHFCARHFFEVPTILRLLALMALLKLNRLHWHIADDGAFRLDLPEVPGSWSGAPEVAALKAREGLHSTEDVQGWLMARLAGRLAGRGLRSAAWQEAVQGAQGGIGHDALIFSWTGQGAGITAARAGHEVVMCPAQNVYLDMAHCADPADWGATWAGVTPLEKVVDWQVVPSGAEDIAGKIIGVHGTFWGEFTTADAELEPMLAPHLLGVAAKAREPEGRTDGAALRRLAGHWRTLFDAMGWEWNRSA